ncbi:MAG TPA: O-antigen ligase family protein, partial [Solirubrobacteraceae bacterium]|nr:O-antigen ligase family protein [Solirubrobacteraceae bacterium]
GQLAMLYLGGLLAATMLLRGRGARLAEPGVALGTLVVIGYGLSERWLPGMLHFARSLSAEGRLEQPLTYWNGMGELAAIGAVVSLRLAGDGTRPRPVRLVAAAALTPLIVGLYISFSRGALFAAAAGIITLVVLAPSRAQLRSGGLALAAGILAAAACSPFHGFTSVAGGLARREREGAIVLGIVVLVALAETFAQRRLIDRREVGVARLPSHARWLALGLICAGLAVAIIAGAKESSSHPLSGGAGRLTTLQSNRYAYWRVALRAFADEPIRGVGAGGWAVYWQRLRPIDEFARDAHSLPLQILAELGLIGLALLAAFLAGIGWAARVAYRLAPSAASGPIAGVVAYVAHAPLDWDWEMPAVTLVGLLLAAALLGMAEGETADGVIYTPAMPSEAVS